MLKDYRYKVNQQDVIDMTELRKLGFTQQEIAESFNISRQTVRYWTDKKYRDYMRHKNAKRIKTGEEKKRAIEVANKKRKENWEETPMSKIQHHYYSRKSDVKSRSHGFKTMLGQDKEVWDKIIEQGLLKRPNSKIYLEEE
jgi:predicted transcriptional regulator